MQITIASTPAEYNIGMELFKEYADSLDFTLSFQNFDDELKILPEMYGAPKGALLLASIKGEYVGAAGLRQIEKPNICEIKRMYIRPGHQGQGIGKALMKQILETARLLGYTTVKLDTLAPKMPAAVGLYRSFGFIETLPYNFNPHEGILYFEKKLNA